MLSGWLRQSGRLRRRATAGAEHTRRLCPGAVPAAGSCPGHRCRHHAAFSGDGGEYDHVAAAVYLMKHARSAALVVFGVRHGDRPVGVRPPWPASQPPSSRPGYAEPLPGHGLRGSQGCGLRGLDGRSAGQGKAQVVKDLAFGGDRGAVRVLLQPSARRQSRYVTQAIERKAWFTPIIRRILLPRWPWLSVRYQARISHQKAEPRALPRLESPRREVGIPGRTWRQNDRQVRFCRCSEPASGLAGTRPPVVASGIAGAVVHQISAIEW
jgi:hypothetical protein